MSNDLETTTTEGSGNALSLGVQSKAGHDKRLRWFEVALVLCITVGSSVVGSFYLLNHGSGSFYAVKDARWPIQLFQEVLGLLLLRYVLFRRGLGFKNIGFTSSFRDLWPAFYVTVAANVTYLLGYFLVHKLQGVWFSSAATAPKASEIFGHPSLMALPVFLINPFFEELIVRAYLMTEIGELTGSWVLSAGLSTALQFSYHLYYGWEGALSLSFQFLVFSIYYARTRKATPVILAHGFFDIIGLLRLWR